MAYTPLTDLAQATLADIKRTRQQTGAIAESADPALRAIEVQTGMVPGANVLQANLRNQNALAPAQGLAEATSSALPNYVNAYRAYQQWLESEAEKKRKSSGGSGGGDGMGMMMPEDGTGYGFTMPDVDDYLTIRETLARKIAENARKLQGRAPRTGTMRQVGVM